ncbi:MAG: signal recognition particle subunit SRP19/SEC65 family protein [Methanocorpusculum sp.]|nr:signal recognition particle subunit SRP19/SEC65 family protein [Methanocorpusculum sp.]
MAQRVLYPCYFDAKLTRKEGRRVARELAVGNPAASAVMRAARSLGLSPAPETKTHPARWFADEGRIVVEFTGSKEELLKKIAEKL